MIEQAYLHGEQRGIAVYVEDEAGPYQAVPHGGEGWQPVGEPARQPHEYLRAGTAKLLTLFHPASGQLHVRGVTSCPNTVLHPWLQQALEDVLDRLPEAPMVPPDELRLAWQQWQEGLSVKFKLLDTLPPLRMLLVLDNLKGHKTPMLVRWLMEHGVMPLYTPIAGSWLNMAESIQRIIVRRALAGQCPTNDNALDGFRHVEPAPSNGRVKRHDPVLHQPADQHRRLMTLQIVKHQQHAERGQGVEQLELDAETFLPLLPGQTELVRRHHGCLRETV